MIHWGLPDSAIMVIHGDWYGDFSISVYGPQGLISNPPALYITEEDWRFLLSNNWHFRSDELYHFPINELVYLKCVGQTGWLFFCCCPHCILSNRQAISALSVCHAPGVLVESLAPELIQNKSPQGYIWNKVLLVCNKFHVRACLAHGFIPGQEW